MVASPTLGKVNNLIFWAGDEELGTDELNKDPEISMRYNTDPEQIEKKGRSMYVDLFEDMLREVLLHESHLFTGDEVGCFQRYNELPENAKYLLVRLCLRKTDKWHRLGSLKYESELGRDGIIDAMHTLCGSPNAHIEPGVKMKEEEREVIDLTMDSPVAGPSALPQLSTSASVPATPGEPDYSAFAHDISQADICEVLECLSLDELRTLGREMKLKVAPTRTALINSLLNAASTQSTLNFFIVSDRAKGKAKALHQSQLPSAWSSKTKRKSQQERLREMAMKILVHCIRLNEDVVKLYRRLNLVYFRSTQHSPSILTPSILSRAHKRSYPPYTYIRTTDIWPSRTVLLAYEAALETEAKVDTLFENASSQPRARSRSVGSKTPAPIGTIPVSPSKTLRGKVKQEECQGDDAPKSDSGQVQAAKAVKKIFEEVYPQWQDLVNTKGEEGRSAALQRFECGHVLTRVICKGAYALHVLKEHEYELEVLETLLAQTRWRRGRRGGWHERRALILMTHMEKDTQTRTRSMHAVIEALKDDDTHIIYRPKLERRLTTLEKQLKIPLDERHICEGKLEKPEEVFIEGVRVTHRAGSLVLDQTLRMVNKPLSSTVKNEKEKAKRKAAEAEKVEKRTGKSIWYGRDSEEINVEMLALQHYEIHGYKGFHCEGRIVTTLFGLLFWDILFAPVPGAFETQYQAAPLDIAEDTFYISRQSATEQRLLDIENGEALAILERIHDEHAAQETWCVGVRWDLFQKQDLLEIAKGLGAAGLSVICRILCEDYAGRTSGVPDLIVWNAETGDCKFVEVKGPGDTAQENQKIWFDVLARAKVPVEICYVAERGKAASGKRPKSTRGRRKTAAPSTGQKRKRRDVDVDESSSDFEEGEVARLVESEDEIDELAEDSAIDMGETSYLTNIPVVRLEPSPSISSSPRRTRSRLEVVIDTPPRKKRRQETTSSP